VGRGISHDYTHYSKVLLRWSWTTPALFLLYTSWALPCGLLRFMLSSAIGSTPSGIVTPQVEGGRHSCFVCYCCPESVWNGSKGWNPRIKLCFIQL